ncbi:endoplasmic reticulum receptor [Bacillus vallismortis]|nr:endoplasmic reticulum receptor [Bacillus vallismortis]
MFIVPLFQNIIVGLIVKQFVPATDKEKPAYQKSGQITKAIALQGR